MRIRKIALGLATAFVLAAPVSGVAFTAPSVVEAATIDMLTTRVTPESSIDVEVVFTLTDDSKLAFANDLDTILSLTLTGSKNVVINGKAKVATVQNGVVYLDDETLVSYVTKTTNTTFTINWPAGLREETVKLFGDFGALARDYACDINVAGTHFDAFQAADGVTSVQINGTTRVNYTVSDGSLVFDGDVSSLFTDLKDKNKVQVTVESLFKKADGIQKASDGNSQVLLSMTRMADGSTLRMVFFQWMRTATSQQRVSSRVQLTAKQLSGLYQADVLRQSSQAFIIQARAGR